MSDNILKSKKFNTMKSISNNGPIMGGIISLLGSHFKIIQVKSFITDSFAQRLLRDQEEKINKLHFLKLVFSFATSVFKNQISIFFS